MKVEVNSVLEKLQLKARDAINFMEDHPALNCKYFNFQMLMWFGIHTVCKRRYTEFAEHGVTVYNKGKDAIRFKKEFEKELQDGSDFEKENPSMVSIEVPYHEYFGEPWQFDHVEYWGELSILVYDKTKVTSNERDKWSLWHGVEAHGHTYEELMINLAKKVKKEYGNFNGESFKTSEELKNNKEVNPFLFETLEGKHKGCVELHTNPKYMHVSDAEKNMRWQQWMKDNKEVTFPNS